MATGQAGAHDGVVEQGIEHGGGVQDDAQGGAQGEQGGGQVLQSSYTQPTNNDAASSVADKNTHRIELFINAPLNKMSNK